MEVTQMHGKREFGLIAGILTFAYISIAAPQNLDPREQEISFKVELSGPVVPHRAGQEAELKLQAIERYRNKFSKLWESQYKATLQEQVVALAAAVPNTEIGDIKVRRIEPEHVETIFFPQTSFGFRGERASLGYFATAVAEVSVKVVTDQRLVQIIFDQPIVGETLPVPFETEGAAAAYEAALKSYAQKIPTWTQWLEKRFQYVDRFAVIYVQDALHLSNVNSTPSLNEWRVRFAETQPSAWILTKEQGPFPTSPIDEGPLEKNQFYMSVTLESAIYPHSKQDDLNKIGAIVEHNKKYDADWLNTFKASLYRQLESQVPVKSIELNRGYESVPSLLSGPTMLEPKAYSAQELLGVTVTLESGSKIEKKRSNVPIVGRASLRGHSPLEIASSLREAKADYLRRCAEWREAERIRYTNDPVYQFVFAQTCDGDAVPVLREQTMQQTSTPPYPVKAGGFKNPIRDFRETTQNAKWGLYHHPPYNQSYTEHYTEYINDRAHVWVVRKR